jgi:hypothetical protein
MHYTASLYLYSVRRESIYMIYKMNAGELDNRFIKAFKGMFLENI